MKNKKYHVTVKVAHTVELDVDAVHSRAAAHVAADKLRTADLCIGDVAQTVVSMEILTARATVQK